MKKKKLKQITVTKERLAFYLSSKTAESYENHCEMLNDLFEWLPEKGEWCCWITWDEQSREFIVKNKIYIGSMNNVEDFENGYVYKDDQLQEAKQKCDKMNKAVKEILQDA